MFGGGYNVIRRNNKSSEIPYFLKDNSKNYPDFANSGRKNNKNSSNDGDFNYNNNYMATENDYNDYSRQVKETQYNNNTNHSVGRHYLETIYDNQNYSEENITISSKIKVLF